MDGLPIDVKSSYDQRTRRLSFVLFQSDKSDSGRFQAVLLRILVADVICDILIDAVAIESSDPINCPCSGISLAV